MNAPEPPTHTVHVSRNGGRRSQFVTHSAEDAETVAAAFRASGFDVDVEPVQQPAIQGQLREAA